MCFAVVTFVTLSALIFDGIFTKDDWRIFHDDTEAEYRLFIANANMNPGTDLMALAKTYHPIFDLNVSVIDLKKLPINIQDQLSSSQSKMVYGNIDDDFWQAYFLLPASTSLVLHLEETDVKFTELNLAEKLDLIVPILLLVLVQIFGVFFVIWLIRRPINRFALVAKKLGEGDYTIRANEKEPAPIDGLATSFNAMADQIESTIKEQEVMIGAIPHELRTPISRLRFICSLARKHNPSAELSSSLDDLDQNFDELEEIISQLLELLKAKQKENLKVTTFEFEAMVDELMCEFSSQTGVKIEKELAEEFQVTANRGLLFRAVSNVMRNAVKYASSTVKIKAFQKNGSIYIVVDDDGPGIQAEHAEIIFSPFSRIDESRNKQSGGVGLGLSIVKAIMQKLGGTVEAHSNEWNGARITLCWPKELS